MRLSHIALALAASTACHGAAFAQNSPGGAPEFLTRHLRASVTVEAYLQQVMRPLRQHMGQKGYIDQSDVERLNREDVAAAQSRGLATFLPMDTDGDGKVSKSEVDAAVARNFQGQQASNEAFMQSRRDELMKADANRDGVIDVPEMRAHGEKNTEPYRVRNGKILSEYLAIARDGKVTPRILIDAAARAFNVADQDRDTIISEEEARPYRPAPPPRPPQPLAQTQVQANCALPKVIDGSKLVLYGTGSGTRQATVSMAGDDGDVTHVADVRIEPGDDPLYIVLTSYQSMLWRFSGDTSRVVRVAATSTRRADNSSVGAGGSGVTGIPKERVSFLASWNCLREFRSLGGIDEAKARGILESLVGRQPDTKGASEVTEIVSIPSMKVDPGKPAPHQELPIVDADPAAVAAAVPVKRFDVMPGRAGIRQLTERGHLEPVREGSGETMRIVKTFPRFPTGLTGSITIPRFLLGKGVEMPAGPTGWACVVSEETGRVLTANAPRC